MNDKPDVDDITLRVRVQPRSSHDGFDVMIDGRVHARVNAAPVSNAANKHLIALLASQFRVAKSDVEVVSGATHRDKRLCIRGARQLPSWLQASSKTA
jgi:uncharacterized protein (TIGR00251 family)